MILSKSEDDSKIDIIIGKEENSKIQSGKNQ